MRASLCAVAVKGGDPLGADRTQVEVNAPSRIPHLVRRTATHALQPDLPDELLRPLLEIFPVSAQPLAVHALVERTRVLPIAFLLLMVGWCSRRLLAAEG
jgi:hypothetical protein